MIISNIILSLLCVRGVIYSFQSSPCAILIQNESKKGLTERTISFDPIHEHFLLNSNFLISYDNGDFFPVSRAYLLNFPTFMRLEHNSLL